MVVFGLLLPPLTSTLPSGRSAIPGQNMSTGGLPTIVVTDVSLTGSNSEVYVLLGLSPMSVSKPVGWNEDQVRTSPFGKSAAAMGMFGSGIAPLQAPAWPAVWPAPGWACSTRQITIRQDRRVPVLPIRQR